jgi:hypothetical protein
MMESSGTISRIRLDWGKCTLSSNSLVVCFTKEIKYMDWLKQCYKNNLATLQTNKDYDYVQHEYTYINLPSYDDTLKTSIKFIREQILDWDKDKKELMLERTI